jgi:hypothetical protein
VKKRNEMARMKSVRVVECETFTATHAQKLEEAFGRGRCEFGGLRGD